MYNRKQPFFIVHKKGHPKAASYIDSLFVLTPVGIRFILSEIKC